MSVATSSHTTTRFSALVIDRQRCRLAQYVPNMVFEVVRTAKTSVSAARLPPATRSSTHNHNIPAP